MLCVLLLILQFTSLTKLWVIVTGFRGSLAEYVGLGALRWARASFITKSVFKFSIEASGQPCPLQRSDAAPRSTWINAVATVNHGGRRQRPGSRCRWPGRVHPIAPARWIIATVHVEGRNRLQADPAAIAHFDHVNTLPGPDQVASDLCQNLGGYAARSRLVRHHFGGGERTAQCAAGRFDGGRRAGICRNVQRCVYFRGSMGRTKSRHVRARRDPT